LDFIICSAWLYCCAARGGIGVESTTGAEFVGAAPAALLAVAPFGVAGFDCGVLAGGALGDGAVAGARGGCTGVL
jgi:hypothetical protein